MATTQDETMESTHGKKDPRKKKRNSPRGALMKSIPQKKEPTEGTPTVSNLVSPTNMDFAYIGMQRYGTKYFPIFYFRIGLAIRKLRLPFTLLFFPFRYVCHDAGCPFHKTIADVMGMPSRPKKIYFDPKFDRFVCGEHTTRNLDQDETCMLRTDEWHVFTTAVNYLERCIPLVLSAATLCMDREEPELQKYNDRAVMVERVAQRMLDVQCITEPQKREIGVLEDTRSKLVALNVNLHNRLVAVSAQYIHAYLLNPKIEPVVVTSEFKTISDQIDPDKAVAWHAAFQHDIKVRTDLLNEIENIRKRAQEHKQCVDTIVGGFDAAEDFLREFDKHKKMFMDEKQSAYTLQYQQYEKAREELKRGRDEISKANQQALMELQHSRETADEITQQINHVQLVINELLQTKQEEAEKLNKIRQTKEEETKSLDEVIRQKKEIMADIEPFTTAMRDSRALLLEKEEIQDKMIALQKEFIQLSARIVNDKKTAAVKEKNNELALRANKKKLDESLKQSAELAKQVAVLTSSNSTLVSTNKKLDAQFQVETKKSADLVTENETRRQHNLQLAGSLISARARLDKLEEDHKQLHETLQAVQIERDELKTQKEEYRKTKEENKGMKKCNEEYCKTKIENEELKRCNENCGKQITDLEKRIDALTLEKTQTTNVLMNGDERGAKDVLPKQAEHNFIISFDIECIADGFPDATKNPIQFLSITLCQMGRQKTRVNENTTTIVMTTHSSTQSNNKFKDQIIKVHTERDLLLYFTWIMKTTLPKICVTSNPDFDWQYIMNRCTILGVPTMDIAHPTLMRISSRGILEPISTKTDPMNTSSSKIVDVPTQSVTMQPPLLQKTPPVPQQSANMDTIQSALLIPNTNSPFQILIQFLNQTRGPSRIKGFWMWTCSFPHWLFSESERRKVLSYFTYGSQSHIQAATFILYRSIIYHVLEIVQMIVPPGSVPVNLDKRLLEYILMFDLNVDTKIMCIRQWRAMHNDVKLALTHSDMVDIVAKTLCPNDRDFYSPVTLTPGNIEHLLRAAFTNPDAVRLSPDILHALIMKTWGHAQISLIIDTALSMVSHMNLACIISILNVDLAHSIYRKALSKFPPQSPHRVIRIASELVHSRCSVSTKPLISTLELLSQTNTQPVLSTHTHNTLDTSTSPVLSANAQHISDTKAHSHNSETVIIPSHTAQGPTHGQLPSC